MTTTILLACLLSTVHGSESADEATDAKPNAPTAEEATPKKPRKTKWFPLVLPLAAANTTDGFGFGLGGQIYTRPWEQKTGYRFMATFTIWTTAEFDYTSNWVRLEHRGRQHWLGELGYRLWTDHLYAGAGGADILVDWGDRERANFIAGPYMFLGVAQGLGSTGIEGFLQLSMRVQDIDAAPNSLLEARQPFGVEGGFYADLNGGVQIYRTDTWPIPDRGLRLEVASRVGFTASAQQVRPLWGIHAEYIGWKPIINKWLVVGGRILMEKTIGQRPFFEQNFAGGRTRDELGLEQALSGYGRLRTRGDGLVAAMVEVRPTLFHVQKGWFDVKATASLFAEEAWLFDQFDPGPHMPTLGVGLNGLWQGAIQVRPYVSWGWRADEPGGERYPQPQYGFSFLDPL